MADPGAIAIIQARMGSSRLPGKVLRPLAGHSLLSWVVRAAHASQAFGAVVVATTTEPADDDVEAEAANLGAGCHRGPVDDVLTRYVGAHGRFGGDPIVRLTADCPLLDPLVIAAAVAAFDEGIDYLSTTHPRSLPRGLDVEVLSARALAAADADAHGVERVHVTPHLYTHPGRFRLSSLAFEPRSDDLRVTVDTAEDLAMVEAVVAELGDRPPPWRELVDLLRRRPDLVAINAAVRQKEMGEG